MKTKYFLALVAPLLLAACQKDDDNVPQANPQFMDNARALVLNEGNFGMPNASLSVLFGNGVLQNRAYEMQNGVAVGDVLQSAAADDEHIYLVVNNSQHVQLLDRRSLIVDTVLNIPGSSKYPRYAQVTGNGKVYVTNGSGEGEVWVLDAANKAWTGQRIPVGSGPERMAMVNDRVVVANSGGFGEDSTVTIIDVNTDAVLATVEVGHRPTDLVVDADNRVWVLCNGFTRYDENFNVIGTTPATLAVLDPVSQTVIKTETLNESSAFGAQLEINTQGNFLYLYLNGEVKGRGVDDSTWSTVLTGKNAYGFAVSPENTLFLTDAGSFVSNGSVVEYHGSGQVLDSMETGIAPNGVLFLD